MIQVKSTARMVASSVARWMRPSERIIADLPDWAGFGNQLFFLLWAYAQQRTGVDYRLVRSRRSEPWLERFPLLASDLTIDRRDARLEDRRDTTSWADITAVGRPQGPSWDTLGDFIETYLIPAANFTPSEELSLGLTVNVRRGDYFSDPNVRGIFSFDQIAYLDVVLGGMMVEGRYPEEIRVVSDDLPWCRARLQHLERDGTMLRFLGSSDPLGDLRTAAGSRELIIMNSTFSIWAAYISNHLSTAVTKSPLVAM